MLTPWSLHYFRREEKSGASLQILRSAGELFGEERGCISLHSVHSTRVRRQHGTSDENDAWYELEVKCSLDAWRGGVLVLRSRDQETVQRWARSLDAATLVQLFSPSTQWPSPLFPYPDPMSRLVLGSCVSAEPLLRPQALSNEEAAENNNVLPIAVGYLDKARDGAVRSGWTTRFFVLTHSALFYLRRPEPVTQLLGEERARLPIADLLEAKVLDTDQQPEADNDTSQMPNSTSAEDTTTATLTHEHNAVNNPQAPGERSASGGNTVFTYLIIRFKSRTLRVRSPCQRLAAAWVGALNKVMSSTGATEKESTHQSTSQTTCVAPSTSKCTPNPAVQQQWRAYVGGHSWGTVVYALSTWRGALYTGTSDGAIRRWALGSRQETARFVGHSSAVTCLNIANDILFTGSRDGTVRSWNCNTTKTTQLFKGHAGAVLCLAVCDDVLYSGGTDYTARAWDISSGHQCTVAHYQHVLCLQFQLSRETPVRNVP